MTHRMVQTSANVAKVAKAAPGDDQTVYRLEDMLVEEVSLVDRPANKRKFLVVKRSDQMPTEVTPNGKGGFTASGDTSKGDYGPPGGGAAPPAKGKKKPAAKAGAMEFPPGFQDVAGTILDKIGEKLSALQDSVKGGSTADIGEEGDLPGIPAEFANQVQGIMSLFDRLASMYPTEAPEPDGDETGAGESEVDATDTPSPGELQMRLAIDNLSKVFSHPKVQKAVLVQKVGAKMSKDRLARFEQALSVLGSLLGELRTGSGPDIDGGAAAAGAGVGKAKKDPKEDAKKALDAAVAEALKPVNEALTSLTKTVAGLATFVKKQAGAVSSIEKSRSTGNALPVDTKVSKNAEGDGDFSWPMDMNNPVTRDNVSKTESFFDD